MTEREFLEKYWRDRDEFLRAHQHDRSPCEVWSRVMGYHRPVSEWNPGKRQEFHDRRMFEESRCQL
jgi:anaerobic ribonucleoside-triphosphate reductase